MQRQTGHIHMEIKLYQSLPLFALQIYVYITCSLIPNLCHLFFATKVTGDTYLFGVNIGRGLCKEWFRN